MKTDLPDKSVRPYHPPTRPLTLIWMDTDFFFKIFSGFRAGNGLPFFCRVTTRPARHILQSNPNPNSPNPTQLHLIFLSHIFCRLSFSLSSVASLVPPSLLCLPHSLTASLHRYLASRRHFVDLSPYSPLRRSLTSRTASSSGPSLPSRPHPVRSLAFLTASLVQIWFVVLIFFLG